MKTKRYMLIHMETNVKRFKWLFQAKAYARKNCQGSYEFYVIVDVEKNKVVWRWSYSGH